MNETTVLFGPQGHLVGTYTQPAAPAAIRGDVMLLLTNAGVIPRIGPHRINVRLARHFARLGVPSLRFDTSGLGDSGRSTGTDSVNAQFVADTRAAMDAAQVQFGQRDFVMIGFCSGGDIAHLVALEDERLKGIVLFDSYVYPTRKTRVLSLRHRLRTQGFATLAQKALHRAAEHAKRLLSRNRGDTGTRAEPRAIFGRVGAPPKHEFGARIDRLVARGVKIMFVYSGGEPHAYNYFTQFRDTFVGHPFVDRVAYEYLDRCDHVLTQPHAQDALIEAVQRWFDARLPAP